MNKRHIIIGSILVAFVLTLAGCSANPDSYINKRIERAKLLNEIRTDKDEAKILNESIKKSINDETKKSVAAEMKKACSPKEIDKLVESETCYVDKLQKLNEKRGKDTQADFDSCYKNPTKKATKELSPECNKAIMPLDEKLNPHLKPRT